VPRPHVALAAAVATLCAAAPASAQASPRRGTLRSLDLEHPGVWLSADRIYGPGRDFLSACSSSGCAPVVERHPCHAPECPGSGQVHTVARPVASIGDWPTDVEGFTRERQAILEDSELSRLPTSAHPAHGAWARARERERARHEQSVRWVSPHRSDGERWELALGANVGTMAHAPGTWLGATASLNLVYYVPSHEADDSNEDDGFLGFMLGDTFGPELRTHFLYGADTTQAAEWVVAVGLTLVSGNRFEESVVRLPTFIGTVFPEIGVIFRSDQDATYYLGWDVPFSFLVDHDLAFDLAARVLLVPGWRELPADAPEDAVDPTEAIFLLNAGFRLP